MTSQEIGEKLINAIIESSLFHANEDGTVVWAANAPEQIGELAKSITRLTDKQIGGGIAAVYKLDILILNHALRDGANHERTVEIFTTEAAKVFREGAESP